MRATDARQGDGGRELLVTGEIINRQNRETPVPSLRFVPRGEDGRQLYLWTKPSPKSRLTPHERVAFKTRLAAPPAGVLDVLVKFAQAGDKASFAE